MFYRDYLKIKQINKKLLARFDKQEEIKNEAIFIRDILIYPSNSHGESKGANNIYAYLSIGRLIDHIEFLANIANEYHQTYYCEEIEDEIYLIKSDCLNKITRILLNEFSLYTKNPLQIKDFNLLVDAIYAIAKKIQENVHLLLSSMPVLMSDGVLLNMTLYVQCGNDPKVNFCCKSTKSQIDISYTQTAIFSQHRQTELGENANQYISSKNGLIISTNTVFSIKTAGSAEYIQAIDICLDHTKKQSKKIIETILDTDASHDQYLIPEQVDHIITSNSVTIAKAGLISESVVQIDPKRNVIKNLSRILENDIVNNLDHFIGGKYFNTTFEKSDIGFVVKNPHFGCGYIIAVTNERALSNFTEQFKNEINNKNSKVKFNFIQCYIENTIGKNKVDNFIHLKKEILNEMNLIAFFIFEKLKPNRINEIFNKKKFLLQLERLKNAKKILYESKIMLMPFIREPIYDIQPVETVLNDLKLKFQHNLQEIPDKVLTDIVEKIDDMLYKLQHTEAYSLLRLS